MSPLIGALLVVNTNYILRAEMIKRAIKEFFCIPLNAEEYKKEIKLLEELLKIEKLKNNDAYYKINKISKEQEILKNKWQVILDTNTWDDHNKTKEQVVNLCGYFEGVYEGIWIVWTKL